MTFNATVHRVMIASPSDVAAERRLARDVVAEWTAIHSYDRLAVLLPVSWESHSSPEMGTRPQGIINRRLLADCDLLIAMFWTRIGSPTGEAASGTVEEIERHIAGGKEAMIYFSQAPVRPDSVDANQYAQLTAFRQSCQARGLFDTYESLEEFREKLSRQLAVTMIRLTAANPAGVSAPLASVDVAGIIDGMRERLSQRPPQQSLSTTATELLKAASLDNGGSILHVKVLGGAIVQAKKRQLNVQGDARDTARWEAAIEELERVGYIKATSYKREIFQLTSAGFDAADQISISSLNSRDDG